MKGNPTLALMRSLGIPETRENYLELAYLKKNPELSAEEEAGLPARFRRDAVRASVDLYVVEL